MALQQPQALQQTVRTRRRQRFQHQQIGIGGRQWLLGAFDGPGERRIAAIIVEKMHSPFTHNNVVNIAFAHTHHCSVLCNCCRAAPSASDAARDSRGGNDAEPIVSV